jgi:hypothetical protein
LFSEKDQRSQISAQNWFPVPSVSPIPSVSPAPSVSPSDSISQQQSSTALVSRPAIRPTAYPFAVLWSLEDCRTDRNSGVTESNKSRPPMDRVIHHEDGSQITSQEWNTIKASARMLKYELRQLPLPLDRRAQIQSKTKVFYKQYYPKEWTRMILQLEEDQPLLKLCCSHWKAEHVGFKSPVHRTGKKPD